MTTKNPLNPDSTLADALARYASLLDSKADSSRLRNMERHLHSLREILDTISAAASKPLEPIKRRELGSGLREATAVFGLSDVHAEERVRKGETPTENEYTPAIAAAAIQRFGLAARWHLDMYRAKFKITDAILWLGGDLMTGHIHEELKSNTETPPIKTILWLRSRLVDMIDGLLEDPQLVRLTIPCSYGNHGRTTVKSYRALGAAYSYEWLLYQWLQSLYENDPRVQFLADESAHQYVHAYDFDLHFHHGDETRYQGGVGGITIPLNKATAQWDLAKKCHYHHFGHWHQYTDTGRIVVNGSCIGYNAYAMAIKAAPEPPAQFFYLLDSKRGKTAKSPLWVRA